MLQSYYLILRAIQQNKYYCISIFQVRKQRPKQVMQLAQDHTAREWPGQTGGANPRAPFLFTTHRPLTSLFHEKKRRPFLLARAHQAALFDHPQAREVGVFITSNKGFFRNPHCLPPGLWVRWLERWQGLLRHDICLWGLSEEVRHLCT